MLNDNFFEEMGAFLIYEAIVDSFSRLSLAVDLLYSLAAGAQISLGHEEIVTVDKIYYFLLIIFPDLYPFASEEITEKPVKLDLVVDKMRIIGIVISFNEIVVPASGNVCIPLGISEVIHLIKPVIHVSCAELSSAVDHIEKYPHAGFPALVVDILYLGVHRLIVHARNAPYKIT